MAEQRAQPRDARVREPAHVRRVLDRTDTALLTFDGIETNGIRYRDAAIVTGLLDNLASTQAVRGRRKDGTITIEVRIRTSPGDLDSIQVWDPIAEEWVVLPSTQPLYTHRLSEWEHREFTRMAKRRNEPFASERHRLDSKSETMRLIDEMAPHLAFQQRRNMAALYLSRQAKKLGGTGAAQPAPVPLEGVAPAAPQATMETGRQTTGNGANLSDEGASTSGTASETDDYVDWDGVETPAPADVEDGYEPPAVNEDWSEEEA